jgi:hypothetical protein
VQKGSLLVPKEGFCARGLAAEEQRIPKTNGDQVLIHLNSASI